MRRVGLPPEVGGGKLGGGGGGQVGAVLRTTARAGQVIIKRSLQISLAGWPAGRMVDAVAASGSSVRRRAQCTAHSAQTLAASGSLEVGASWKFLRRSG